MTTDPVQLLIAAGAIPASPFDASSRYAGVPLGRYLPPGAPPENGVNYVLRRFIPQPRSLAVAFEHIVSGGERPDTLAHATLGDAAAYWRLADVNAVVDPLELTDTPGMRVKVPLPAGF